MERKSYTNGKKMAAVILQMVFLTFVIVVFSLLDVLSAKSIFTLDEMGNNSFFNSRYYKKTLVGSADDLLVYLDLRRNGRLSEKQEEKRKQYYLEFDNGDTNFKYFFNDGHRIYSNIEGDYSKEVLLEYAKELGSYLYYDDRTVSYQGNIKGMKQYFSNNMLRLFQRGGMDGVLMLGVDTQLEKDDIYYQAQKEYEAYAPWLRGILFLAMLSFFCFLLCLIYATVAAGRSDEDEDNIRLCFIDKIPTEILFLLFCVCLAALISFSSKTGNMRWDISGLLIFSGTLCILADGIFLTIYLSFVRRIKAEAFLDNTIVLRLIHAWNSFYGNRSVAVRTLLGYCGFVTAGLILSYEAFAKKRGYAFVFLAALAGLGAAYVMWQKKEYKEILDGVEKISAGDLSYKLPENELNGDNRVLAASVNTIGDGLSCAVDDMIKSERMKADLITNMSHDIKTPLTSIINYVNLLKLEKIQNEKVKNYVNILEQKSLRLKQLTEELVEASRISSGNITLDMQPIDMVELVYQTGGEFNELFESKGLTTITRLPKEPVMICADGNRIWRIVENLYGNVAKYALKDTRVYVEIKVEQGMAVLSIKDISEQEIDQLSVDLSERFVRGDESRTTEGNGLGLSIAKSLTVLMGGSFEIDLDGDLFKAVITFPVIKA